MVPHRWPSRKNSVGTVAWKSTLGAYWHSLGGNAVVGLAQRLDEANVPVSLLITFDATEGLTIPRNVSAVINFHQQNGVGKTAVPSRDFAGELINVDLTHRPNISHTNIEKLSSLHAVVIEKIGQMNSVPTDPGKAKRRISRVH